jgi:hypothetical protein
MRVRTLTCCRNDISRSSALVWLSAMISPTSRGSDSRWRLAMRRKRRASQLVKLLPMNSRWLCSSSWNSFSGARCSLCSAQMNSSSVLVGDHVGRRGRQPAEQVIDHRPLQPVALLGRSATRLGE